MTNDEIKNRILMEMNEELTSDELRKLKMCLERNFYGVTVVDNCTDIVTVESVPNEKMISKFVFEQKIAGLSDNTIKQYKRETERFFSVVNKNFSEVNADDISYYLATLMSLYVLSTCEYFLYSSSHTNVGILSNASNTFSASIRNTSCSCVFKLSHFLEILYKLSNS